MTGTASIEEFRKTNQQFGGFAECAACDFRAACLFF